MCSLNIKFPFPFIPYKIQEKFMRQLYITIEENKLGIFESPTGTGKSLSICCGALQWFQDYNQKLIESLDHEIILTKSQISLKPATNDWLQEEYENIKMKQTLIQLQNKVDKIKKQNDSYAEMKARVAKQKMSHKSIHVIFRKLDKPHNDNELISDVAVNIEETGDEDLLLEDSNQENLNSSDNEEAETKDDVEDFVKIYISSRTHSQLSQFVGEIKRTVFKDNTRVVTLASRQHYCINPEVNKLKNMNLINESCLDMQKSKSKSTSIDHDGQVLKKTKTSSCKSCPYYNQSNITKLKERILVDIMEMEDLIKCGKHLKACPYYASRMALEDAQVVLMSHAGIVSSGARSGISLKLNNNILILDEAHGLTAALENAHSAPVSSKQLNAVKTYLQYYISRYQSRLSSKNLLTLNQVSFVVVKMLAILKSTNNLEDSKIYSLEDFVIEAGIDHMNLRPLVEFCRNTKLAPKLHGFSMRYNPQMIEAEVKSTANKKSTFETFLNNISKKKKNETEVVEETKQENSNNPQVPFKISAGSGLYAILDFLQMLCERSENGRVLVQRGEDGLLKYLLLNPAERFADVVSQCRSVIVAGGTMEPISEFMSLLTSNNTVPDSKVNIVRCEHVVPEENVLGICLSKGPSNMTLNYSYENRMSHEMLHETGRILRNICSIVPGGVVCFLPSYSYEQVVFDHMKKNKVIDAIMKKKSVFREPKSAADVDQVLSKFAAAVKKKDINQHGALLLSVVGGKLSEGLNFSDDLGRCVIVIGMPYPNIKSPELQEKMNYLNRTVGGSAGNNYYENLCTKAVNQCIGRALRHANDYACVLLVDERYSRQQTMSALPSFVQKSLVPNCSFGQSIGSIAKFFSKHKEKRRVL